MSGRVTERSLDPWMVFVLRLAGTYNVLAGLSMVCFYHEGYQLLGVAKPQLVLPVQGMGVLVALFGVGYHWVASDPLRNGSILVLGFWSKLLAPILCIRFLLDGTLPWWFLVVLLFSDLGYLPFFYLIIRRLNGSGRTA